MSGLFFGGCRQLNTFFLDNDVQDPRAGVSPAVAKAAAGTGDEALRAEIRRLRAMNLEQEKTIAGLGKEKIGLEEKVAGLEDRVAEQGEEVAYLRTALERCEPEYTAELEDQVGDLTHRLEQSDALVYEYEARESGVVVPGSAQVIARLEREGEAREREMAGLEEKLEEKEDESLRFRELAVKLMTAQRGRPENRFAWVEVALEESGLKKKAQRKISYRKRKERMAGWGVY